MKKTLCITLFFLGILLAACRGGAASTPSKFPSTAPVYPQSTQSLPPTIPPDGTDTATPVADSSNAIISFANDVSPIFATSCYKCHGIEQTKEGLDITSYENLMAGSFNGPVITPGDSGNSYLIQLAVEGKMPKRGLKLTAEQIKIMSDWVDQGALNN